MSERLLAVASCAALLGVVGGCSPVGRRLDVDVRTDLVPGREFSAVSVTVATMTDEVVTAAFRGDDYLAGVRVAELGGLPDGRYLLHVGLLDAARAVVVSRDVDLMLRGDYAVTVVISRDCRGVTCGSGLVCSGGTCTDPTCTVETPALCPVQCMAATACAPPVACADATCQDGLCLAVPVDARCPTGQRCDLDVGCVADTGPCAAGTRPCGDACAPSCTTTFDVPTQTVWTVPRGCERPTIHAWGAGGALASGNAGGAGGYARATVDLVAGTSVLVAVGAPGAGATAGSPGGGAGGAASNHGGGGGGYSGVFTGSVSQATALVIAGGGGGGGGTHHGGAGGGTAGVAGQPTSPSAGGGGGTATAGGAGGAGIMPAAPGVALAGGAGTATGFNGGGGGGGGYFGGGGGSTSSLIGGGGGGGSGFATGSAPFLEAGTGVTPGGATEPLRGDAATPDQAGRVVVVCL